MIGSFLSCSNVRDFSVKKIEKRYAGDTQLIYVFLNQVNVVTTKFVIFVN